MEINLDDWDMLPTQEEVYENNLHKIIMHSAGLGSGKTHNLCRKLIKLSALNQNMPGAIMCPTFKDFRRDVKPEMFYILEECMGLREKEHFWFHKSYSEFTFIWNKKPLYVLSGETPIAGPNLAYCGINEFSLIQFERIKEMLRRVRLKEAQYPQKILVGTPEDIHGWLEDFVEKQEDEEKKKPGSFVIYYSDTRENIHIDPDYRSHLESMLDNKALKVFASGQIVRLSGDYYYYAFSRDVNVRPVEYDREKTIYVGLDFNVGKMACHFAHKVKNDELNRWEYHIFDELLLEGDSDTPAMAKAIISRYPKESLLITCDSAGSNRKTSGVSDVRELLSSGFRRDQVRYKRANPRHRERQLLINNLLSKGQVILDPKCKLMRRDLEKVQQKKVDFSKEKDKDDKLTHFSDGLDYSIDWEFALNLNRRSKTIQL